MIKHRLRQGKVIIGYEYPQPEGIDWKQDIIAVADLRLPTERDRYIGLTDSAGEEIYENDIVRSDLGEQKQVIFRKTARHNGWNIASGDRYKIVGLRP